MVVVEKKQFPREKTCGDGLTPRAVRQLADMDLEGALAGSHRYSGLRAFGFGRSIDMPGRSTRTSRTTATPSPATTSTGWWPARREGRGDPAAGHGGDGSRRR